MNNEIEPKEEKVEEYKEEPKPITKKEFEWAKSEYMKDFDKEYKKFKMKGKVKKAMVKSLKKKDEILVFYMNLRRELEGPFLSKIYGGNFLVIKNHVYRFNPKRVLRWRNKYSAVIVRAWDRDFVGCDDYDEIMKSGDQKSTINDPVLIKAVIAAKLAEGKAKKGNIALWIIIGIAIIIGVSIIFGKKTPAPTP